MDKPNSKNRRDYGDSSLILAAIVALSEKPVGFRRRVVHSVLLDDALLAIRIVLGVDD